MQNDKSQKKNFFFFGCLLAKGDVTLMMADGDLIDLMTGKLNAQTAFFQGKLKIKGNMGLAMKLKEIKPPEGGAPMKKEGGAPGADSGFKCAPVFGQIKAALDQVDYFALIKSAFTVGRGATGLLGRIKQFSKSGIRFPIPYSHFCFTKPLATSEFTKNSHQEFLAQVSRVPYMDHTVLWDSQGLRFFVCLDLNFSGKY